MKQNSLLFIGSLVFLVVDSSLIASDAVTSGEFIVEPSTFHNLGFEWKIEGDDNRNATVAVSYRAVGTNAWKPAQPLLRIGDEKVWRAKEFLEYWTPRMFAGSIFGLEPGQTYECRFEMSDPDGVSGQSIIRAPVQTRSFPKPYEGGRVLHVYPPYYDGPRQEPSFTGLLQAYYGPGLGDWDVVHRRPAQPGDTILVHAGLYKADRRDYVNPHQIPFHGTYVLTLDGTAEKPITIKGAGDGEVIFDGDNVYRLFDVMASDHHIFEGITVRNTEIAFYAGLKDVLGCSNLTVQNCRIEDVGIGIHTEWAGSKNFYIADNVMIGRDDHYRLNGWNRMTTYGPAPVNSYYGVKVYGQGHVICYNKVSFFHDGICISTYGLPEEDQDLKCVSIDIYNNDVFLSVDDFIETDGGVHNIRVMRNRGFNAAHHGLSAQPMFGGPVYFIGNLVYNVPFGGAIKTGGANPAGVLVYHNTFIAENSNASGISNAHYRNNLFLGTNHPNKPVLRQRNYTSYSSADYNGYRPNQNGLAKFMWAVPENRIRDYELTLPFGEYASLQEFQKATGQEEHGILVDYDVFVNMVPPNTETPHAVYQPDSVDFRLQRRSAAIDVGMHLPNINDGYTGEAPDLGALEFKCKDEIYGPRNL
ncbi:MAG: hypothetical protein O7C75_12385 [Verrucomicrobia bacterium]|nr:hypothetical protein [Verrucomicrobiota bacterium]